MEYKILGDYIKRKRELKGMTQKQLSEKLGMTNYQSLGNAEYGTCSLPLKYASKLCEILEIDPLEFRKRYLEMQTRHLNEYL